MPAKKGRAAAVKGAAARPAPSRKGASQTSEATLSRNVSGAGTAATITLPAAGLIRRNVIKSITASYSAAPTGGNLQITDGGVTVFDADILLGGPFQIPFPDGVQNLAVNSAFVITLAGGGGAIVAKLSVASTTL